MVEIVILAGGKGTRMRSSLPKILHTLCDKPMIHWIIEEALKVTSSVNVILGHKLETTRPVVEEYPVKVWVQDLENFPGSGGALMACASHLKGEKIIVINGDTPLIEEQDIRELMKVDGDVVVGVMRVEKPNSYGRIIMGGEWEIERIVEVKDATPEQLKIEWVNSGIYLFRREIIEKYISQLDNSNAQEEFYVTQLVELAKEGGAKVVAVEVDAHRLQGINNKKELAEAEAIKCREIKNRLMEQGVIMHLPETIFIDAYSTFEGECQLEPGVVIKKSRIVASKIKANSVIEGGEIIDSEVGPMARIRPKTRLEKSKIGNFVEVKASKLKEVKAGHLSYLGDSEIGEGTNIGAGTITCNYDGKGKYKTKIGKNVFVGSDTKLIAPVNIGDETIIGAGSVVNKDVPQGALALSRPP
ncbi:MAG: UDP-N-acetylglucosamine diphosphorylase/glucosamine-1-phosphate N-acetyltransferase, partial [Epsilonproteobacteria bacterium]|nr:UDP-N-acetylglucosamine diphosphorylase/glucosamine-1-phosphate N-acetyltransferase [Campylobacterota bacterium]NPA89378.1 UDP-N-acetylglucosamine diphosphorylase/glucosamine-1-phosphate N-acetyltransferase [Campylobacterota bacterium]